jgi:hypothetical protein
VFGKRSRFRSAMSNVCIGARRWPRSASGLRSAGLGCALSDCSRPVAPRMRRPRLTGPPAPPSSAVGPRFAGELVAVVGGGGSDRERRDLADGRMRPGADLPSRDPVWRRLRDRSRTADRSRFDRRSGFGLPRSRGLASATGSVVRQPPSISSRCSASTSRTVRAGRPVTSSTTDDSASRAPTRTDVPQLAALPALYSV